MDASELYWLSFRAVFQALQGGEQAAAPGIDQLLKLNAGWLLHGLCRFKPPSPTSAAALKTGGALKAPAWGARRGIAVDKSLIPATLELSQLLVRHSFYTFA